MCHLLFLSGLLEDCLDLGRDEKSRSVLFDCCTNGLVGGINTNDEDSDEWDVALDLTTGRLLTGSLKEN